IELQPFTGPDQIQLDNVNRLSKVLLPLLKIKPAAIARLVRRGEQLYNTDQFLLRKPQQLNERLPVRIEKLNVRESGRLNAVAAHDRHPGGGSGTCGIPPDQHVRFPTLATGKLRLNHHHVLSDAGVVVIRDSSG